MPNARQLTHVVDFEKRSSGDSTYGAGGNPSWVTATSSVRASVEPLSATRSLPEQFEAERMQGRIPHEVTVRKPIENSQGNEEIPTPDWRMKYDGRTLEIANVQERREDGYWWRMIATEDITTRS